MAFFAARKVGQLGAGGRDAGLPFLIGIADDGVGVGDIKIIAEQSDAERRIEVVQEDGSQIGNAITIAVAQQRDAVSALGCGAGEPRSQSVRMSLGRLIGGFGPLLSTTNTSPFGRT